MTQAAAAAGKLRRGSLALLRSGDPERPLFVPWDDTVRSRFAMVEQRLERLPLAMGGPDAVTLQRCARQPRPSSTDIDALVDAIEAHMSRWTALQHLLQTGVLTLAVPAAPTLLLTGYRFVLEPVSPAKRAIERLQGGDFSARVERPQQRRVRHPGRRLQRHGRAPAVDVPQPGSQGGREDR